MEFGILGPLRVSSGDGAVVLGAPAQRGLLAVLLTSPNIPIPADRLADELWGDRPPPSAHHLLHVYVSRLRQLLAPLQDGPRIGHDAAGYAVRVAPGELDADQFVAAAARGRELRDVDPEAADVAFVRALGLWRGAPFADLQDAPPSVRDAAAYLQRQRLEAVETWNDVRLRLGRHRDLVPELSGQVVHQPYDETLHAQLMLALYRCGRQAEALDVARALQLRLREDLGIDPSAQVRELYRNILLQATHLDLEPPEPPGNLPARLTSFVGRARELREVIELLETSRLVTLTGPGGIGKTRLAIEVARRERARYPGGVWWIDLAPLTEPAAILGELAGVLGVTPMPGSDMVATLALALSRRRTLLLIDNCEQVAAAVGESVAGLLRATVEPRVLVTSRTPLWAEGERLWTVPPLGVPTGAGSPAELAETDAGRLFLERGRAVLSSFNLDASNAAAVADVCRRLDGISLAIEMAAARLPMLTPREITDHLDDRFALLELPTAGRLTRHRTLTAAFDASYVLLSPTEQLVFERLSVFVGPFDLDAGAAVGVGGGYESDRAFAAVAALVDASMLTPERDGEQTRYRLLETLREYGAARLRVRGAVDDTRRAHAAYHLDLAARAGADLGTPAFTGWMARLGRSYPEVRSALGWSLDHQPRAVTLRAVPALREFWYRRGDASEAGRWTARMLDGDLEAVPPALLAEAYIAAAFAATLANDLAAASSLINEGVRLAHHTEGAALVGGLWGRAAVAYALGDLDGMRRDSFEGLAICDRNGDRWGRAGSLANLGLATLTGGGPPAEVRAWLEEALPLYRELGDLGSLVLIVLGPLSTVALRQGDLDAAERYATEGVELSSGTGWQACALACYADVLTALGDLAGGWAAAARAVRVALEAGLENWFRIALRDLAQVANAERRYADAALLAGASRRNMPSYGLDPSIYGPLQARCRDELGAERFDQLAGRGAEMSHDDLVDLVGAR